MRRTIVAAAALAALAMPASLVVVGGSTVAGATPKSLVCSTVSGKRHEHRDHFRLCRTVGRQEDLRQRQRKGLEFGEGGHHHLVLE